METTPLYTLKKLQSEFPSVKITSSQSAADFIRQFYSDDIGIFESFFLLTLNNQNQTTGYMKISQGGITGTVVDIKIVVKYAIENLATGVIFAHNHPSGTLRPSEADLAITKKLKDALNYFEIRIQDHIILTEDSYYSFQDNGHL